MQVCFFAHTAGELRQPSCEVSEETRLRASHLLVRSMFQTCVPNCRCCTQYCMQVGCIEVYTGRIRSHAS